MLTQAQKKYQNSSKGIEARRRYMEKRKTRLAAEKVQKETQKAQSQSKSNKEVEVIAEVEAKTAKPIESETLTTIK